MANQTTQANRGSTASGFPVPGIDSGASEQWRQREVVVDTARPQVGQASNDITAMRTSKPRYLQSPPLPNSKQRGGDRSFDGPSFQTGYGQDHSPVRAGRA